MAKLIKPIPTPDLQRTLTAELLGQVIKARRTQSQLRLEDAAALCHVAKQTLQNMEHGLGKNRIDTILQICAGLGIKLCILPWSDQSGDSDNWK